MKSGKLFVLPLVLILAGAMSFPGFAQTSDQAYSEPLEEVLQEAEKRFGVELNYKEKHVDGLMLSNAYWRFRPDFEKTMHNILSPFDLFLVRKAEKVYSIKPYRHSEMSPEDGREFLGALAAKYHDIESWEERKDQLRDCMYRALHLSPLPPSPGSKPLKSNFRKYNGYTIENIALETLPGLYVCGSLYRPEKIRDKIPVILCPNGHFQNGRYNPQGQYRCAMLAKMGAISISYDLFAYGESLLQFKPEDHHRSLAMTVQALNSLRILDYLLSHENADPERVAITGGSGGGSQSMLITALDERIDVSVPVVMLSAFFAGGCPCESGMPVHLCGGGTSNPEIAAMAAPRPQLIVSDGGDWTRDVPATEYPYLQRVYGFYGKRDLVRNVHLPDEGHDYGPSKRLAMYEFLAEHLELDASVFMDADGNLDESGCVIEDEKELLVFGPGGKSLPENAIKDFATLEKVFAEITGQQAGEAAVTGPGRRAAGAPEKAAGDNTAQRYRIAVCDWMILKRQKPGAFERTKEIGADGLEVDMGGLGKRPTFDNKLFDPLVRKQFLDRSRELSIEIASIAMSGFYAQSFPTREGIERIIDDCINTMILMGVKVAFLPLGVEGDMNKYPERREAIVERLKMAGKKAEAAGVVIGIETSLDAKREVELLDEIGSPAIQSYFNFQNPLVAGRDLCEELKILGKNRICQFHCTDSDGVLLEHNERLDMQKVKETLDEMGWSGWLVIERSRDADNTRDVIGNFGANTRYIKRIFQ
jgi:sugar phosphate isomerase/epimerase